jgi:hypothetical protein
MVASACQNCAVFDGVISKHEVRKGRSRSSVRVERPALYCYLRAFGRICYPCVTMQVPTSRYFDRA